MHIERNNPDQLFLNVGDVGVPLTQAELDHLISILAPYAALKERHIFALFQGLDSEAMEKVGMLLQP